MKTHVIHLAAHDDYHSARDQMTWAKSARILLVLPKKEKILRNKLDLVLLERQAASLGAQLALVSDDEVVMGNAGDLKIPVFETIKEAQRQSWKTGGKRRAWTPQRPFRMVKPEDIKSLHTSSWLDIKNTWVRVGIFSLGVLAVIAILIFLIPSAEIKISPQTKTQSLEFTLRGDQDITSSNISGLVPIRPAEVTVKKTESATSTGSVVIGDSPATGDLLVSNLTDSPITIPQGTVVMTLENPVQRYKSTQPVKLEGRVGAKARVPIEAVIPGSAGNIPAGAIGGVEGEIGLNIAVTNPDRLDNGSDRKVHAPSQADFDQLESKLKGEMPAAAGEQIQEKTGLGSLVFPDSIKQVRIAQQEQDPQVEVPSETLTLSITADYSGLYASREDIEAAAGLILDANLPAGFHAFKNDMKITKLSEPDEDGNWKVRAERKIAADIERQSISQWAAGQTIQGFLQRLPSYVNISGEPAIQVWPFSFGRMPFLSMRIHVSETP